MAIALKEMIEQFAAMEKAANETLAATPEALVGVESLPGAEHDAKVPESAKKPDKEVQQGQPAGATTAAGAVNGGDAKPLNETKLEIDQPLLNAEQKPLITDDALTAKEASESSTRLASLVNDILDDLKSSSATTKVAAEKKDDNNMKTSKKEASRQSITLDNETIAKLAAAQAAYMGGRSVAQTAIAARNQIKEACVKAAQAEGLDATAANAAADNAMAAAGMPAIVPPEDGGAETQDAGSELPDDVSEEEVAGAIVDLVQSGELDVDTAKAIIDEMIGADAGSQEDDAAAVIAQALESGEITPEDAQEIAAQVEAAEGESTGAEDASVQGDQAEAEGAAVAEDALKQAAAELHQDALQKIASHIVESRASAQQPQGSRVMNKVASILEAKAQTPQSQASEASATTAEERFLAGFCKKAAELGVDPAQLAQYALANHQ